MTTTKHLANTPTAFAHALPQPLAASVVRVITAGLTGLVLIACSGCFTRQPIGCATGPAQGPLYVPASDSARVWERTVEVLNEFHFNIARENRLEGVIETEYKPGAGILEPWHPDAVTSESRWEGTLQSIRRRAVVTQRPAGDGGNFIEIRVDKEIEDLPGLAANSPGAATFQENTLLQRDLNAVVGQTSPSQWLSQGRDHALEQALLARLRAALMR